MQTAAAGTYASPLDCATKLFRADGPAGFYKVRLSPYPLPPPSVRGWWMDHG